MLPLPIHFYIPEPRDNIVSRGFWEARRMGKKNTVILALLIRCPGNQLCRPTDSKNISPTSTPLLNSRRICPYAYSTSALG